MSAVTQSALQRHRISILRLLFLMVLPLLLFTRSAWEGNAAAHETTEVVGALLVITGVLGRFWSILYSGGRKNQTIVQEGPYSVCRHPLYLFSTVAVVGFGVLMGSLIVTLVLGVLTFAILAATARDEERFLRSKFGERYDDYAARVPAILPKPSLFSTPQIVEFDTGHLRTNLRDALVFLCFLPVAELIEFLHEEAILPSIPLW